MKQLGLSIPLFIKRPKVTRRQKFLEEMEQVIPWAEWTNRIAPRHPVAGLGRKPFELEVMLRIHMMQLCHSNAREVRNCQQNMPYSIACWLHYAQR